MRNLTILAATAALAPIIGCASPDGAVRISAAPAGKANPPTAARPDGPQDATGPAGADAPARGPVEAIDLTEPGAVAWGSTPATTIDTRAFPAQITDVRREGPPQRVKNYLPPHEMPRPKIDEVPTDLPVGGLLAEPRTQPEDYFPGISQTGWVPPDCSFAVGPNHIVTTVNQTIAFYDRAGNVQFQQILGVDGNPGFFEDVGAGNFTFDPKCFYDHYDHRFVVVAPEVYGSTEAWITIAVSDDANPHGIWHKYRTNAVINVGGTTFWWDYPGFGYDRDGYYVTCNLFGLNQSAWGGVGYRIFNKTPMLTGQPAVYSTLRDGSSASVQVAQHFGPNLAPFFVSASGNSGLRVQAIRNPMTAPTLVTTAVGVPAFNGPGEAPAAGGNVVSLIDSRIMNVVWRDGRLLACHNISIAGRNFARWYHLNTNLWPSSGFVGYLQSGNIDAGGSTHTFFPAVYTNRLAQVGLVCGTSSSTTRIGISTTGRQMDDPSGTMGSLTQVRLSDADGGGRWGDYYDMALDPVDDTRFWGMGEYIGSGGGWATWISSFDVGTPAGLFAILDQVTTTSGSPRTIDVLANDYHTASSPISLASFDPTTRRGGTVTRSVGTGPGGRDELIYQPPVGLNGQDSFTYAADAPDSPIAEAGVIVAVYDEAQFRVPENPAYTLPGARAAYYALSAPSALPNFAALTPYLTQSVAQISYPSTNGAFAGSGRADNVGAVFSGFVTVPALDYYTFYLASDDGSRLLIGNTVVVNNDGLHGMEERSGVIGLRPGTHAIRIEFFERTGGAGLIASLEGGGLPRQVIPAALWSRPGCAADIDGNGAVDLTDLSTLLAHYGVTSGADRQDGDLDGDGDVELNDLALMLSQFGAACL